MTNILEDKKILSDFENAVTDRVLLVIDDYISRNKETLNYVKFAGKIGMHKQKLSNIRAHRTKFTHQQLQSISKITGLNLNFAFGVSREMYNKVSSTQSLSDQLQDLVTQLKNVGF